MSKPFIVVEGQVCLNAAAGGGAATEVKVSSEAVAPSMLGGLPNEFWETRRETADLLERRLARLEKALGLAPLD